MKTILSLIVLFNSLFFYLECDQKVTNQERLRIFLINFSVHCQRALYFNSTFFLTLNKPQRREQLARSDPR